MTGYSNVLEKLASINQEHLLAGFDALSEEKKNSFLTKINHLDIPLFLKQQALIKETETELKEQGFTPLENVSYSGNSLLKNKGRLAIDQGLVGAIVVAGGQGTRLGFFHPKGMYKVTKIKKKSLFQLFAEKAVACGKRAKRQLPLAFMTSQDNDIETKDFFKKHALFGAHKIDFFLQGTLPFLNEKGDLFLKGNGDIATGPDGNGSSIQAFVNSPLFESWKREGVRYVLFSLIDNPLADPFDEELVGRMIEGKNSVVIKAIERKDPLELLGLLVNRKGKAHVIEYTEFPKNEGLRRNDDGSLTYNLANISLFCLDMDFIEEISRKELPLHKVYKGAWKFERYIFDILPFAKKVETVIYPRDQCFSPLKNAEGEASPKKVEEDIVRRDRSVLLELLGTMPPPEVQEIAQDYYYPTEELKKNLQTLPLNTPYLDSSTHCI